MLKFIAFALAIRLLLLTSCEAMSVSKRGQVKLCGRMLAETLNLLCQGQYYDPEDESENEIAKKNFIPQGRADFYPGWFFGLSSPHVDRPYDSLRHHAVVPGMSRQQRGVVDDCCAQACSPSVLLSYCGTGK